jgi:hypothetical protein
VGGLGEVIFVDCDRRNFFGVKKVLQNGTFRSLLHGDTTHGLEDSDHPGVPLSYYFADGTMVSTRAKAMLSKRNKPP